MGIRVIAVGGALAVVAALVATTGAPAFAGTAAARPAAGRALTAGQGRHRPLCPAACRPAPPQRGPVPRAHLPRPAPGAPATIAAGSWGFDVNANGCNGTSFAAGAAPQGLSGAANLGFDAIQLNGWGWYPVSRADPCYAAQAQWYAQNDPGQQLQFIMFPVPYDNPDSACDYATSPADGHTAGWDQAQLIYQSALAGGLPVGNGMWWLDIEATQCSGWIPADWQTNLAVVQGAVDYLHSRGVTVGIYTDPYDWDRITNSNTTQFANIPAWNPDTYNTSPYVTVYNNSGQNPYDIPSVLKWAQSACGQPGITGGPLQAVQYMWGDYSAAWYQTNQPPAILGRDFDYQCRSTGPPLASDDPSGGAAVVHGAYTSVFTVDTAGQSLQETYLPVNGGPWYTQSLSANYGTPSVAKGTVPVGLFHDGYTSVYTVNATDHTLQETYLTAIGQPWHTQDLSTSYGTPPIAAGTTPAVVYHGGYVSVYTVNAADHTLQETYLSAIGQPWHTQNLSTSHGTPPIAAGTSPAGVFHTGYTSVYTVNAADHTLQETYLSAIGQPWHTQNLSASYGTPPIAAGTSPAPVVHTSSAGVLNFTSVYTINATGLTVQETYLAAIGDPWHTQQLPTPPVAAGTTSTPLYHTGYTSVYTLNATTRTLEETYLPVNGGPWHTQSLSASYGTPAAAASTPVVALVHPDHTGILDFTSVYTINATSHTVQETYLAAVGDPWHTQQLPTPPATK
ncbi:MAG TPA: hypothetical protein VGS19_10575, partial [Streptosporangiaceae bacterium]|nr:hypothetical protein [Streptosporangiaceae bacterium]